MSSLIKQDLNFLEYPLWIQNDRSKNLFVWEDREGFVYRSSYKPPSKTDIIFLYYLLFRSQQQKWNSRLELSHYEILKGCNIKPGKTWRKRLRDSLLRWSSVTIEFQGSFYDGESYTHLVFHVINSWKIREKNRSQLVIEFSPEWLEKIQHSYFFKLIDFEQLKKLRSALTIRLYEILLKNFQGREEWKIEARKLAEKIPMAKVYPSEIIPKIKAALNRINEKTDLKISLEVKRPERGKAILQFTKLSAQEIKEHSPKIEKAILDVPEEKKESLSQLLELVPKAHRQKKTIREMLSKALRKQDEDYVKQNILYTNETATKNYRAYLEKALRNNWAEDWEENGSLETAAHRKLTKVEMKHLAFELWNHWKGSLADSKGQMKGPGRKLTNEEKEYVFTELWGFLERKERVQYQDRAIEVLKLNGESTSSQNIEAEIGCYLSDVLFSICPIF